MFISLFIFRLLHEYFEKYLVRNPTIEVILHANMLNDLSLISFSYYGWSLVSDYYRCVVLLYTRSTRASVNLQAARTPTGTSLVKLTICSDVRRSAEPLVSWRSITHLIMMVHTSLHWKISCDWLHHLQSSVRHNLWSICHVALTCSHISNCLTCNNLSPSFLCKTLSLHSLKLLR